MFNGIYFIFVGTLGWGISLYLIKVVLQALDPLDIVLYRMVIGFLTLLLLAILSKRRLPKIKSLCRDGFVVGLFNMAIPFYLTTVAEEQMPSSLAAIINGLTPLFTLILGCAFFGRQQKFNLFSLTSLVTGFIGVILINFNQRDFLGQRDALFALLVASASYGVAANYVKSYAKVKDPIWVAAMAALISACLLFICKLAFSRPLQWPLPITSEQYAALIWLGALGSGISLFLYCFLIQRVGAVLASMITYLVMVTGVIVGMVRLHEPFSLAVSLGCGCVMASLFLCAHAAAWQQRLEQYLIK